MSFKSTKLERLHKALPKINKNGKQQKKRWLHPAGVLVKGAVLYTVKYLGSYDVEQPKGIEIVRDAIRRMRFDRNIKNTEGDKPTKCDLAISIRALTLRQTKSKTILFSIPLHNISFCAHDKQEKKTFAFIARDANKDKHICYVFCSVEHAEKLALTVGQAFNLAYQHFRETNIMKEDVLTQLEYWREKSRKLEEENEQLRREKMESEKAMGRSDEMVYSDDLLLMYEDVEKLNNQPTSPVVGRRLENLILSDNDGFGDNFSPPSNIQSHAEVESEKVRSVDSGNLDVFGMDNFTPTRTVDLKDDAPAYRIQNDFSRGISFECSDRPLMSFEAGSSL